jgi:porin
MPHITRAHLRWHKPVRSASHSTFGLLLVLGLAVNRAAFAQPAGAATDLPAAPEERNLSVPGQARPQEPEGAAAETDLWSRSTLLGTLGGLRPLLDEYGVSVGLTETSEVLGNPTGGRSRGVVYEGLTQMSMGIDLDRAIGLSGGILNIDALQIHGRGLSVNNIGNLSVVSNIEADRSTRLFEFWYQQSLLDGMVDVKVGQQSADLEFMTTVYGGLFINSSFGWPTLTAVDLPSGGPAYPLGTPAFRVRVRPTDQATALLGVFNGNPAGAGTDDPQIRDRSGTNFNLNSGVFVIGEVQYSINQGEAATGLPGIYKFGAWYNSNTFVNQFYAVSPPANSGQFANAPPTSPNDWSIYAVMDQLVFRTPGTKDGGVGLFTRVMGAPGDRNQVNFFVDGGVSYKGPFGRNDDTIGLGFGVARISDTARAGDAALRAATGGFYPSRTAETIIEATYQFQFAPWLIVQPDVQYVIKPGGGIVDPASPTKHVGDAAILGVRTTVTF